MGWFNKKKVPDFIDLGERMAKQQERAANIREGMVADSTAETTSSATTESSGAFGGFFADMSAASNPTVSSTPMEPSSNFDTSITTPDEKRRRLAKRLKDMTDKLEDISNQMYHLQQRVEVIERKMGVGF